MTDPTSAPPATEWPTGVGVFLDVDGVTLHARRDGAWANRAAPSADAVAPGAASGTGGNGSAPPILYLHSLGADLRIFDEVVARLPGRRHLRFDLRGHGLSDAPEGPYSIERQVQDALAVLEASGEQRAVLVGVSVGGMVALRAALDRPDVVAGLVLSNTAAKLGDGDIWRARIEAVAENGVEALADSTLLRWFPEPFRHANAPLIDGLRNMLCRTSAVGYACTCAGIADEDLNDRLAELAMRTLVIGGSDDLSTPPPVVRQLAKSLEGARLEIIDDAGHLPMVDAPGRFTELLTGYLTEVADG